MEKRKVTKRRSVDRGRMEAGWLSGRYTFSFGRYYDAEYLGFGALRVINEDRIQPRSGFPTHAHRNMEILTYVISGTVTHRDSAGGAGNLGAGKIQLMRAGRGIQHSEMNESANEELHVLQIWIEPSTRNSEPGYEEREFARREGSTLIVSPTAEAQSLRVDQDILIYRTILSSGEEELALRHGRAWVQVIAGNVTTNQLDAAAGDGVAIESGKLVSLSNAEDAELLIFDLK